MGRWIAFVLMLVGISVLGVVTASIAAWFVGRGDAGDDADLVAEIRALRAEVAGLREQQSLPTTVSGRTEA